VQLVVWPRCVLESRVGAEDCAYRLRGNTQRIELVFLKRQLVGWGFAGTARPIVWSISSAALARPQTNLGASESPQVFRRLGGLDLQ